MTPTRTKILITVLLLGILAVGAFWSIQRSANKNDQPRTDEQIDDQGPSGQVPDLPPSSSFSFAVEADPHMDEQSDPAVYRQTLADIVAAKPSFVIDLGDTFMIDKLADKSDTNIRERYTLMQSYFDLLSPLPLYFALGNHDGETGWDRLNTKRYRQEYFPAQTQELNYSSFEHENSLFVILDPYSYTTTKPDTDGWQWTLGKTQYDWLKSTLENNTAHFKFVFIHQLVGGDDQGRGGIELANLYEWGGGNTDGTSGFDQKRPGWEKPIHQILIDNGVKAVFKGHDHFFARQEMDGIVYQTLPQPSHPGDKLNTAENYGYVAGDILGGSGYLHVEVSSSQAVVQFIRADDAQSVAFSYSIR